MVITFGSDQDVQISKIIISIVVTILAYDFQPQVIIIAICQHINLRLPSEKFESEHDLVFEMNGFFGLL